MTKSEMPNIKILSFKVGNIVDMIRKKDDEAITLNKRRDNRGSRVQ